MNSLKLLAAVCLFAMASSAFAASVDRPTNPMIEIGGLRVAPQELNFLSVSGPSSFETYTWTQEEARRLASKAGFPDKLLEIYTDKGYLVIRSNSWKPSAEGKVLDIYTLISLADVTRARLHDLGNGALGLVLTTK